ncbi:MAG: hypothetical protein KatS3mg043_0731 [Rhodothermaceae bacterium]|nr:MAG: hypothetical protein KatS3mg043_0731 [Rhodothermaceae bacterium]
MPEPRAVRLLMGLLAVLLLGCGKHENAGSSYAPLQALARQMAADYLARQLLSPPPDTLTMQGAKALQTAFVAALAPALGPPVGYKAGLTTPTTQARFSATEPIRGVLLRDMLRPSGDTVATLFGARPVFEGDLVVRVGDEAINTATTDTALLAALDAAIPFIELPDLLYDPAYLLDARALTAANAGARLGILGPPIPLPASGDAYERLAALRVMLLDTAGTVVAEGEGTYLLDHPLHVVRWLRDTLHADGIRLKKGDLLSLGSLTPLLPVQPGQTITARYVGLADEPVDVTVTFE